jgi:Mn2+/Fe2+ NRAMP family transporter
MDANKAKKRVKHLGILWITLFVVYAITAGIYNIATMLENTESPIQMLSGYQIVTLIVTCVFFLPLMYVIYHYASLAGMKKTKVCALVVCIYLTIWIVLSLMMTVLAVLNTF